MDAENDNDQPNSSSASASSSSSNISSSSNLLGHLQMLPFMRSTDDDEPEADGEEPAADGNDNDFNEEPMPLQPPVTATATAAVHTASALEQQPTLAPITTTVSTSAIATATSVAATSYPSTFGREEPMQHHQASPPPQPPTQLQQAPNIETPPPTQSVSPSSPATLQQEFAAADLSQQDQEHQLTAQINHSDIADTIDASAIIVQPLETNAEQPQHPHLYPQEAAINSEELGQPQQEQSNIQLDDNYNNDFDVDLNVQNNETLVNHQQPAIPQSVSLDSSASGSSGPSSSAQHQQQPQPHQTPQTPATLPLLVQQQQPEDIEQPETEESKHLPSYDHHYHNNPNDYHHLQSNPFQNSSCVFPHGYRQSQLTQSNGAHNTINNHLFGNTMSSSDRNNRSTSGLVGNASSSNTQIVDNLKLLYPNVNENETPLPRCWSPHDKCLSIGLSQNNLRVHFKGVGKQNNDAASVRTAHPIPPTCGIYYFEVKIISKGKNGYMGIGLTAQQFRMNRLPGWDKQSYGYHGDDGNSFSSSGHGQSYGPTFTTGDVIGCCVNFVNNTCFYTKNGVDLGIAFRELPTKLYPTVGLQTPGEEVDANFGQEPFRFVQIEEIMKQMRGDIRTAIYDFPLPAEQGDPTTLLQKMVHSYLVHNGYSQTAESFDRQKSGECQSQSQKEDMPSIRTRQKILKMVMSGKMGQAIEQTMRLYPGLLENNKNLWFMLKCRQFIEMINGSDVEYCPSSFPTSTTTTANTPTNSTTTTQTSAPNQTSVIQSTKSYQNGNGPNNSSNGGTVTAEASTSTTAATTTTTNTINSSTNTTNSTTPITTATPINNAQNSSIAVINTDNDLKPQSNLNEHCTTSNEAAPITISKSNNENDYLNDVEMENNGHTNGNVCKNGNASSFNNSIDAEEEMDVDMTPSAKKYSHGIERILEFGKELSQMGQQLEKDNKMTDEERQMLEDAFSLIAYSNPWSSPLGWQLCPTRRETVCRFLNSAILESVNCPKWPPLEYCVAHANELLKLMGQASLGACAFINIQDVFPKN